jgi:ubiquinone/menaquinone biosynthesis C-methylase UbiE
MPSLITRSYLKLCAEIPRFRKVTRKWMYQIMGRFIKQDQWTYMNYGFEHLDVNDIKPKLDSADEINRLSYQLYNHLASEIELENKSILEVGSGRGGGASMINKYHKPKEMIGLDYSDVAVKLSNKNHGNHSLQFVNGDAENLPFHEERFDAVINVESSHCYVSMKHFLDGVKKVLKPGGHFLFTDFRYNHEMEGMDTHLQESGLNVLKKTDITSNVIHALDKDEDRRKQLISSNVPKIFRKLFGEFAGVKDSVVYKQFERRELIYFSYILQKN